MSLEKIVANLVQKIENRFYGKYRGFVVDNADPEQLGRLTLQVPSVLGQNVVTGWAMPCVPYGGDMNQGFLFIPEKGAGVWVEFEEGDLEFPIWVGTFWSKPGGDSELPKPNDVNGSEQSSVQNPPTCKMIKTKKGHTIQFEDADNQEAIILRENKNAHLITMDQKGIVIVDGTNKHEITLDKNGVKMVDGTNKHEITLDKNGIKVVDGANKHETTLDKSGIKIADGANQHEITLDKNSITIKNKEGSEVILKGPAITVKATNVKIGSDSAMAPLVLGNQFATAMSQLVLALSTHTHMGNMGAPTSPPMPPPLQFNPQPLLSTKHTTE